MTTPRLSLARRRFLQLAAAATVVASSSAPATITSPAALGTSKKMPIVPKFSAMPTPTIGPVQS